MGKRTIRIADLFCGGGGTTTGAKLACYDLGYNVDLVGVNHWERAVETSRANHPDSRHYCASLDNINPRHIYGEGELDVLWASPECTNHSPARGGLPVVDQSRASAMCVIRWAEALRPPIILIENVPAFLQWGPLDSRNRPIKARKGEIFRAWKGMLESVGYRVEHRLLCAADYGDPTSRTRLIIQAVRGKRRPVWPDATHGITPQGEVLSLVEPYKTAFDCVDWSLPGRWLDEMPGKKKYGGLPLSPNTLRRIHAGFYRHGLQPMREGLVKGEVANDGYSYIVNLRGTSEQALEGSSRGMNEPVVTITGGGGHVAWVNAFVVPIDHTGGGRISCSSLDVPLSTITTEARHGLLQAYLVQTCHGDGGDAGAVLRRVRGGHQPFPTVCGNRGEWALLKPYVVKYYGNSISCALDRPLDTITSHDRFALVCPEIEIAGVKCRVRFRWRMFQPHELARAQGFPEDYQFKGNKSEVVKQIGNAVPVNLSRALVKAALRRYAA
ncbi:DNA cytosine methyltransferase [Verrucomicrobium spinosum]|uniref:DNA cytosine methyltransferase n=1 Tax=Verrucomicrobium spinosum TaxID=2736 RepID=UPI000174631A|nr:DNA cytosine methyltransferase [Verrucomicrobium spinosum]